MTFRFICISDENYELLGTNDEVAARSWAEDCLVYDTQTGLSLNAGGTGEDLPLKELAPAEDAWDAGDDESEEV